MLNCIDFITIYSINDFMEKVKGIKVELYKLVNLERTYHKIKSDISM